MYKDITKEYVDVYDLCNLIFGVEFINSRYDKPWTEKNILEQFHDLLFDREIICGNGSLILIDVNGLNDHVCEYGKFMYAKEMTIILNSFGFPKEFYVKVWW